MGYDGSGGYDRQRNFSSDASAGIKILASAMDQELNDFASAMTVPILRDGQNEPSANLPMGGNRHLNVGQATSATNYLRVHDFITHTPIFATDVGTEQTNVTVTVDPYVTVSAGQAPPDGSQLRVRMGSNKTGSAPAMVLYARETGGTFGRHSAPILDFKGSTPGNFASGGIYDFVYSSAQSGWQCANIIPRIAGLGSMSLKAKNAAGTTAGVATGFNTNNNVTKYGDMLAIHYGTGMSVSVSISASDFWVSVPFFPLFARKNGFGSIVHLVDKTNGATHPFITIVGGTSGSTEFAPVASAQVTISADTVWKVPPVTIYWIGLN